MILNVISLVRRLGRTRRDNDKDTVEKKTQINEQKTEIRLLGYSSRCVAFGVINSRRRWQSGFKVVPS